MLTPSDIVELADRTWTVKDLRQALESEDDDALVVFQAEYGDHGRTQQALHVCELVTVRTTDLSTTAYSHSGLCVNKDPGDDGPFIDDLEELDAAHHRDVVVLRA